MKDKLTIKEKKLVQGIASGKGKKQAGIEAGYAPNSAAGTVSDLLRKPRVQEALEKALIKHGIDIDSAIAPIGKGLKALKMNEFTGEITEDLKIQMQASDRALKLMNVGQDSATVNINFNQVVNEQKEKYGI